MVVAVAVAAAVAQGAKLSQIMRTKSQNGRSHLTARQVSETSYNQAQTQSQRYEESHGEPKRETGILSLTPMSRVFKMMQ